jgi:hypothetical protein
VSNTVRKKSLSCAHSPDERKREALIEQTNPGIIDALECLVDPVIRGTRESPLRWTSKSTRKLAVEQQRLLRRGRL